MKVARIQCGFNKTKLSCNQQSNGSLHINLHSMPNDSVSFGTNVPQRELHVASLKDFPKDSHGRYKVSKINNCVYVINSEILPKDRQVDFCIKKGAELRINSPIDLKDDTLLNFWGEGKLKIDKVENGKIRVFEEINSYINNLNGGSIGSYGISKTNLKNLEGGKFFAGEKSTNIVDVVDKYGQYFATQNSQNDVKTFKNGLFQSSEKSKNLINNVEAGKIVLLDKSENFIRDISDDADLYCQKSAKIIV